MPPKKIEPRRSGPLPSVDPNSALAEITSLLEKASQLEGKGVLPSSTLGTATYPLFCHGSTGLTPRNTSDSAVSGSTPESHIQVSRNTNGIKRMRRGSWKLICFLLLEKRTGN